MYSCSFPTSQIYLGKHPHERFTEETAKRYMERFHNAMEGIAADILKRNECHTGTSFQDGYQIASPFEQFTTFNFDEN